MDILEGLDREFTHKARTVGTLEEKEEWEIFQIELRRTVNHLREGMRPFESNQELSEDQQMDESQMQQGEEFVGEQAIRLGLRHLRRTRLALEELISEFVHMVDSAQTLEQEDTGEDTIYELQRAIEALIEATELVSPY